MTLCLRSLSDSDLPVIFEFEKDEESVQMAGFTHPDPNDRSAFDAHWAKIRNMEPVVIRTIVSNDETVGTIASFLRGDEREVTYWIGREYWGQGMATKALLLFLDVVTERPLFARVAADNAGSLRVLEKCRFVVLRNEQGFAEARGCEIDEAVLCLKAESVA
jgi:RimJ/RimL family protein N-acetyltransferase